MSEISNLTVKQFYTRMSITTDGEKDFINIHFSENDSKSSNYLVVDYKNNTYYLVCNNPKAEETLRTYFLRYIEEKQDLTSRVGDIKVYSKEIVEKLTKKYGMTYELEESQDILEPYYKKIGGVKVAAVKENDGEEYLDINEYSISLYKDINQSEDDLFYKSNAKNGKILEVNFNFTNDYMAIDFFNKHLYDAEEKERLIDMFKNVFFIPIFKESLKNYDPELGTFDIKYLDNAEGILKQIISRGSIPIKTRKEIIEDKKYMRDLKKYNLNMLEERKIRGI